MHPKRESKYHFHPISTGILFLTLTKLTLFFKLLILQRSLFTVILPRLNHPPALVLRGPTLLK